MGRILKVKTLCDLLCLQRLHPDSHSPFQSELNIVVVNFMFVVMTDELWNVLGTFGIAITGFVKIIFPLKSCSSPVKKYCLTVSNRCF